MSKSQSNGRRFLDFRHPLVGYEVVQGALWQGIKVSTGYDISILLLVQDVGRLADNLILIHRRGCGCSASRISLKERYRVVVSGPREIYMVCIKTWYCK